MSLQRLMRAVVVLAIVSAAACSSPGAEFLGKWVNMKNAADKVEVTRNGDQFLIVAGGNKVGATYKDGALEIAGVMGVGRVSYVRASDTLISPGGEYRRDR